MIDTGADISIFKLNKVLENQLIDSNQKCTISGISGEKMETFASADTFLTFQNATTLKQRFHLVDNNFPIHTDGILGRDFFINYKCNINYQTWMLSFNCKNEEFNVPIEDNLNDKFILPERCEVIRRIPNVNIYEDSLVCSQ